jgi:hypothetical protein
MPFRRLLDATVEAVGPTFAQACVRRGRGGSGGQHGASPALENEVISRVLVDNKSVAEIGKRCLLFSSSNVSAWLFERSSELRQPITVTGGWLQTVKGCPGCTDIGDHCSSR